MTGDSFPSEMGQQIAGKWRSIVGLRCRGNFTDCSNAELSYALNDGTGDGAISLTRLLPDAGSLCESLSDAE
jgi:hypothetical protein